jgi:DNA replication protein DnaC
MERHQIIEMMRELKLTGMRAAFDEILANGLKRQDSIPQIIADLLQAEIAEKQARSIKYQVAIARLPLAKELSDFDFGDTPINESLVRDLATGSFLQNQRNAVLVGGTGTGKSHLAVAIARACIRAGARGRFHTAVDLVNRLEAEARAGRQGRIADRLTRLDFLILDELGYLPFAQSGGQLLFHLVSRLYEQTSHDDGLVKGSHHGDIETSPVASVSKVQAHLCDAARLRARSTSHAVAAHSSCTKIPLSAGRAQEDENQSRKRHFRPWLATVRLRGSARTDRSWEMTGLRWCIR